MGKAQAENNGLLDQQGNSGSDIIDPLGVATPTHPSGEKDGKDHGGTPQSSDLNKAGVDSVPSTPKSHKALDFSSAQSTPSHDKSDNELDADKIGKISSLSHEELVHLFQRQGKTLNRYKTRFSEVKCSHHEN